MPSSRFSGDPPPASIAGHCGAAWTSCCQAALALTGHGTRSKDGTGHNEMAQAIMIELLNSTNSTNSTFLRILIMVQNKRPAETKAETKMYTHYIDYR